MSLDKIQKIAQSLAKSFDDNEKIAAPILSAKLNKYAAIYPADKTIGAIARVVEQLVNNNTFFIRRADLKSLYNKMYNVNTKFAEMFQEELGQSFNENNAAPSYNGGARADNKPSLVCKTDDTVFSNALATALDKSVPLKTYSTTTANKAQKSVAHTLDSWNLKPSRLNIDAGNDKYIVIKADYETPKGISSFYIPMEIQNDKIVEASVFVGNTGIHDLTHNNIKNYLLRSAGQKLKITSQNILSTLIKSAEAQRTISDAELALIRLHESRRTSPVTVSDKNYEQAMQSKQSNSNYYVGQKIAQASLNSVALPKSEEYASFEKNFSSPQGVASFQFGSDNVKIGREVISRELTSFGYKNPQIAVVGANTNTITYGVTLDAGRIAFSVPIKISNGKVSKPTVILCNGIVNSLNKESINKLYINNESDFKVAAAASPLHELTESELIEKIKTATEQGEIAIAEDALNILNMSNNKKAYAIGFSTYLQGLNKNSFNKSAKCEPKCDFIIQGKKNSVSQHEICGHTGLPLHKTFIDKQGNCRPLYRKNMDETYEGAMFMNAKIFG